MSIFNISTQIDDQELDSKLRGVPNIGEAQIAYIKALFWRNDILNSLVYYRHYLDQLVAYLQVLPSTQSFTRSAFLHYALDSLKLPPTTHRLLMEIAIVMEDQEKNSININDFNELLSELGTSQEAIDYPKLIAQKVLVEKEVKNSDTKGESERHIGFFHHSLQEHLATEYIRSHSSRDYLTTLKEFVIYEQATLFTIKSSWYNVIRFFVEDESSITGPTPVIDWLLEIGASHIDTVVDEMYCIALTSANTLHLTEEVKARIFDIVFETYRKRLLWIPLLARDPLARYITPSQLTQLKSQISPPTGRWPSEKYRFFTLGLVSEIIRGVLEHVPGKLSPPERAFWKSKLVEFANDHNDNGVLQRTALSALSHYRGDEIENVKLVEEVRNSFQTTDTLVKQAFLDFASAVAPNYPVSIDAAINCVKDRSAAIHGRRVLYLITSKAGISYLLNAMHSDHDFLLQFLKYDNIFNQEEKNLDKVLIDWIEQYISDLLPLAKDVIADIYELPDYWDEGESYFVGALASLIHRHDPQYLREAVAMLSKSSRSTRRYGTLVAHILTIHDLDELVKLLSEAFPLGHQSELHTILNQSELQQGQAGKAIKRKALAKKLIEEDKDPKEGYVDKRQADTVQEYGRLLGTGTGTYYPQVFAYYLDHIKELGGLEAEKTRLKSLLTGSVFKINPRDIKVTMADKPSGSYQISNISAIFGEAIRTATQLLTSDEVTPYRQQIIDYLPYAYSDDYIGICALAPQITDGELAQYVHPTLLDRKQDVRYMHPTSYIDLVDTYAKKGKIFKVAPEVLSDLAADELLQSYDRLHALEVLAHILHGQNGKEKKILKSLFDVNIHGPDDQKGIAYKANAVLITAYRDPDAITWRIDEILRRAQPIPKPPSGISYSPTNMQMEIDYMSFAAPLVDVATLTIAQTYLYPLIDRGFELLSVNQPGLSTYAYYLFRVVGQAVGKLASPDLTPLTELQKYLSGYKSYADYNWWSNELERLQRLYTSNHARLNGESVKKIRERREHE